MHINGQLSWQDYLHAQSLHTRRVWWQQAIWYGAIVIVAAGFLSLMIPDVIANGTGVIWSHIWPPLVLVGSVLVVYYVLIPRGMRQLFEKKKELSEPFEYQITPGGLVTSNQYGQGRHPWGEFKKWRENQHVFLLYAGDVDFIILPKRLCAAEQIEALRADLQENGIPQADTVSRRSVIITAAIVFLALAGTILYVMLPK